MFFFEIIYILLKLHLKGTLSRDFRPLLLFYSIHPIYSIERLKPFSIWILIYRNIHIKSAKSVSENEDVFFLPKVKLHGE
jgi:hypothetical protein